MLTASMLPYTSKCCISVSSFSPIIFVSKRIVWLPLFIYIDVKDRKWGKKIVKISKIMQKLEYKLPEHMLKMSGALSNIFSYLL